MYKILELQPYLKDYEGDIELRMQLYRDTKSRILGDSGMTLSDFANGHKYFGFHRVEGGWVYREWAPNAQALHLTGDFNNWQWDSHPLYKVSDENWEIFLEGDDTLWEGCRVKVIVTANGRREERTPLYIQHMKQNDDLITFSPKVIDERNTFDWTDAGFKGEDFLYIYEAHVGMAQEEGRIGTYREFADLVLPRIQKAGYNTIQLMAIMEHPYYGSFGYQVSNFFAASGRFGMPNDLKYLVNKAHEMGIRVLLDLVHSHAVKNTAEGINMFDGTVWQFFHDGDKGEHPAWGTKCFDYSRTGVLHFLLSNLKFWLEEYHFDGFRFDGVTSMLYHDHGLGTSFDNSKYFSLNTHVEAVTYLQLANELIREVNPNAITIAEDMSAMPGMCLPIEDGGVGFDYRLAMGSPDMWIKHVKEKRDEDWDVGYMWGELNMRRTGEGTVSYVESHDQALVGDQTMMFRMMGAGMYTDMGKDNHNGNVDRAMALHKMIRLFTLVGGGEAYLNFMGNEFGHPEWIDFPREGNGWSYDYCRRQWSLRDNPDLKYQYLGDFDEDMIRVTKEARIFDERHAEVLLHKGPEHTMIVKRMGLVFAFNFNPTESLTNVLVPVPHHADYTVVFTSDDLKYGGWGRIDHMTYPVKTFDGKDYIELYLPARTCMVLMEGEWSLGELVEAIPAEEVKPAPKKRAPRKTTKKAETEGEAAEEVKPAKKRTTKKTAKAEEVVVETVAEEAKPAKKRTTKKAAKAEEPAAEAIVEEAKPAKKTTRKSTKKADAETTGAEEVKPAPKKRATKKTVKVEE